MHTWAIISQKGGQGKTTLATGFAVEAARDGAAVVILDTDDRQGTASYWENARATDDVTVVNTGIAVLPLNLAKAEKGQADLVIIDTPANSRDLATEAKRPRLASVAIDDIDTYFIVDPVDMRVKMLTDIW